jgi:hypothetical protein
MIWRKKRMEWLHLGFLTGMEEKGKSEGAQGKGSSPSTAL